MNIETKITYFLITGNDCNSCEILKKMLSSLNKKYIEYDRGGGDLSEEYQKIVEGLGNPVLLYRKNVVLIGCPKTKEELKNHLKKFGGSK